MTWDQEAIELQNRLERERQSQIVCRVCGFRLDQDPVPRVVDPGELNIRMTFKVNDYPGGPAYEVHSECLNRKSPVDTSNAIDLTAVDLTDQIRLISTQGG